MQPSASLHSLVPLLLFVIPSFVVDGTKVKRMIAHTFPPSFTRGEALTIINEEFGKEPKRSFRRARKAFAINAVAGVTGAALAPFQALNALRNGKMDKCAQLIAGIASRPINGFVRGVHRANVQTQIGNAQKKRLQEAREVVTGRPEEQADLVCRTTAWLAQRRFVHYQDRGEQFRKDVQEDVKALTGIRMRKSEVHPVSEVGWQQTVAHQ